MLKDPTSPHDCEAACEVEATIPAEIRQLNNVVDELAERLGYLQSRFSGVLIGTPGVTEKDCVNTTDPPNMSPLAGELVALNRRLRAQVNYLELIASRSDL